MITTRLIKNLVKNNIESSILDSVTKITNDLVDSSMQEIKKKVIEQIKYSTGYEISTTDSERQKLCKILRRLDPVKYKKYSVTTLDLYDDDEMTQPLRNKINYLIWIKKLDTGILVNTTSSDEHYYREAEIVNAFVFGKLAYPIYYLLVKSLDEPKIVVKQESKENYYFNINVRKLNEEYLISKNQKTAKRLDQIFCEDNKIDKLSQYISKWDTAAEFFADKNINRQLGILLYGEPGTGKTTIAKSLAAKFGKYLVSINPAIVCQDLLDALVDRYNPSNLIILLEDIDYIFGHRTDKEENKERANFLLQFLDGTHSLSGAIVIATTNDLESLDAAIVREGRFNYKIHVGNINREQAELMVEELNIGEIPFDLDKETFPINPAYLQAKVIEHVFDNILVGSEDTCGASNKITSDEGVNE